MSEAYICDGVRTPIGRFGGSLSSVRADDLAAHVLAALKDRNPNLPVEAIDDLVLGCANQAGEDNRNVARMASLLAGYGDSVPGTTINRLCGSGIDAISMAARAIKAGEADVVIAGGVEAMTRGPFVMPKATAAFSRSNEVFDTTMGWRFINKKMKAEWEKNGKKSPEPRRWNVRDKFRPHFSIPIGQETGKHHVYIIFKSPEAKPGQILLRLHSITCKNTESPT